MSRRHRIGLSLRPEEVPEDWPRGGVPIFFETSVEAAVAKARELAGTRGPVRLSHPEVVEDRDVTHLRYVVRK